MRGLLEVETRSEVCAICESPLPARSWLLTNPPAHPANRCGRASHHDGIGLSPGVVLLSYENQFDAVEAGKPFEQLRQVGMTTAAREKIFRRRNDKLRSTTWRAACCPGGMLDRLGGRDTNSLSMRQGYRLRRNVGVGVAREAACTLH